MFVEQIKEMAIITNAFKCLYRPTSGMPAMGQTWHARCGPIHVARAWAGDHAISEPVLAASPGPAQCANCGPEMGHF
jgi:hypothetical protein